MDTRYYNVILPARQDAPFTESVYSKQNTEAIIDVPENYTMSIASFSIPTSTIPIFQAEYITKGELPLIYTFTIRRTSDNTYITNNVLMVPPVPNPLSSLYYNVYTYTDFINMCNNTLRELNNLMGLATESPYLFYDPARKLLSFNAPSPFLSDYEIWFNIHLAKFFQTGADITSANRPFPEATGSFLVYDQKDNITLGIYKMEFDITVLTRWNDFKNLQISTNLPIVEEYIEGNYGDRDKPTVIEGILSDFIITIPDNSSSARTFVDYSTKRQLPIVLNGTTPIRDIVMQFFWVNKLGVRQPLFIRRGEVIKMKLKFKSL